MDIPPDVVLFIPFLSPNECISSIISLNRFIPSSDTSSMLGVMWNKFGDLVRS